MPDPVERLIGGSVELNKAARGRGLSKEEMAAYVPIPPVQGMPEVPMTAQPVPAAVSPQDRDVSRETVSEKVVGSTVVDRLLGKESPEAPFDAAAETDDHSFGEVLGKGIDDFLAATAQGFTSTFADELAAGLGTITGQGSYEENLARARKRYEEVPESTKIAGEIVGGIGAMASAAPVSAGLKAGQVLAKLPGWLRAAGLGGVSGGAYGFGSGEGGFEKRMQAASTGAIAGATMGAGAYPVMKGIGYGVGKVGQAIKERTSPKATARAKVAERMAADEMTPAKVRTRLGELGPQATIADAAGRNVRDLLRDVAGTPGPAANRVEIVLNQRAEGEGARIVKAINKALDPQDFYAAQDTFLSNMRIKASPIYKLVFKKYPSLMTPKLKRLLTSEFGRKALKQAAKIVEAERAAGAAKYLGKVDEELTQAARAAADVGKMKYPGRPGVTEGFSLEAWDQIKTGFDALLEKRAYRDELTGRLTKLGYAVDQMRRALIKELDKVTGGKKSLYAKARRTFAGEAEALKALREGRKVLNKDPEIITRELADLSETGRAAYRSGAARALKDVVDKTGDMNSAARKIYGNARNRARLRALVPDKKSYNLLARTLIAETRFAQTHGGVLTGSMTTPRQAGQQDLFTKTGGAAGAIMGTNLPGTHALVAAGLGRRIGAALMGPKSMEYTKEIARILANRNQAMNLGAIDSLFASEGLRHLPAAMKQRFADSILLAIGQESGRTGAEAANP